MKKKTGKRIRCGSPAGAIFVRECCPSRGREASRRNTNFQSVKRCRIDRNTERYNVWFELSVTDKSDG